MRGSTRASSSWKARVDHCRRDGPGGAAGEVDALDRPPMIAVLATLVMATLLATAWTVVRGES